MKKSEFVFRYKEKDYWFITSNKSGSSFLLSLFKELLKNNEVEWSFEKFNVENLEVVMYGRNPYTRFISGFYHWWKNGFKNDAHEWGGKWLSDLDFELEIQSKDEGGIPRPNKICDTIEGLSNWDKHVELIKFWHAWIESMPFEYRIQKFRHFARTFYSYLKNYYYGDKQFQAWAGRHLDWQLSDVRDVNRIFPMDENFEQDECPIYHYSPEYAGGFIQKWHSKSLQIEDIANNFIFKQLVDVDKIRKQPHAINPKTPAKNIINKREEYIAHYDDETIEIVNEIYKFDFLLFNYSMYANKASLVNYLPKNS